MAVYAGDEEEQRRQELNEANRRLSEQQTTPPARAAGYLSLVGAGAGVGAAAGGPVGALVGAGAGLITGAGSEMMHSRRHGRPSNSQGGTSEEPDALGGSGLWGAAGQSPSTGGARDNRGEEGQERRLGPGLTEFGREGELRHGPSTPVPPEHQGSRSPGNTTTGQFVIDENGEMVVTDVQPPSDADDSTDPGNDIFSALDQAAEDQGLGAGADGQGGIGDMSQYIGGMPEEFFEQDQIQEQLEKRAETNMNRPQRSEMVGLDESFDEITGKWTPEKANNWFYSLNPRQRTALADDLNELGYTNNGSGTLEDGQMQQGLRAVMAYSNTNGTNPWASVADMQNLKEESEAASGAMTDADIRANALRAWEHVKDNIITEPFEAPDYASLAQSSKQLMRDQLGRDPEDYEIDLLSEELTEAQRLQHERQQEVEVAMQRAQSAQGINQQLIQQGLEPAIDEPEVPEQTQGVDPQARFAEKFEQMYDPEISAEEDEEEATQTEELLMRSLTGMDALF